MGTVIVIVVLLVVAVCFVGYLMSQWEAGRMTGEHRRERKRRQ